MVFFLYWQRRQLTCCNADRQARPANAFLARSHVVLSGTDYTGGPPTADKQSVTSARPAHVELLAMGSFYTLVVSDFFAQAICCASVFIIKENFMTKWIAVI